MISMMITIIKHFPYAKDMSKCFTCIILFNLTTTLKFLPPILQMSKLIYRLSNCPRSCPGSAGATIQGQQTPV